MNETINVLMKRKSVRVYEDREIPQEALVLRHNTV